ncbi:MAG: SDR family oxidoreductase [Solirubrobacteraceae bacterium]
MLLVTGATGAVGAALVDRLVDAGHPVRCLVRDPRRLGARRVRVQIALGDLADPPSFRHALRGVDTVVHLAAARRDQRLGSIEELTGVATWRLVEAARRAGARHFVLLGAQGASTISRARWLRAKAVAEQAVAGSGVPHTILAPSLVYAPGEALLRVLARLGRLPVTPVSGRGRAEFQPIWADDVAACVFAALQREVVGARIELSGPETLTYDEIVEIVLRAAGRPRPRVHVPAGASARLLRSLEVLAPWRAPVTWDEAELLEVSMTSAAGAAGTRSLGVEPRAMADVLGST